MREQTVSLTYTKPLLGVQHKDWRREGSISLSPGEWRDIAERIVNNPVEAFVSPDPSVGSYVYRVAFKTYTENGHLDPHVLQATVIVLLQRDEVLPHSDPGPRRAMAMVREHYEHLAVTDGGLQEIEIQDIECIGVVGVWTSIRD